jgi:hypothetical protein
MGFKQRLMPASGQQEATRLQHGGELEKQDFRSGIRFLRLLRRSAKIGGRCPGERCQMPASLDVISLLREKSKA